MLLSVSPARRRGTSQYESGDASHETESTGPGTDAVGGGGDDGRVGRRGRRGHVGDGRGAREVRRRRHVGRRVGVDDDAGVGVRRGRRRRRRVRVADGARAVLTAAR